MENQKKELIKVLGAQTHHRKPMQKFRIPEALQFPTQYALELKHAGNVDPAKP